MGQAHGAEFVPTLRMDNRRDWLTAAMTSTVEDDRIQVNLRVDDLAALLE